MYGSEFKSHTAYAPSSPQPAKRTRLGWFSTWNSRCGIAEYSKYLIGELDPERIEWTVLAACDDVPVAPDEGRVIRCWSKVIGAVDGLVEPLLDAVRRERFDAIVIQFKVQAGFDFLSLRQLEALVACCHCTGTRVIMILHATEGAGHDAKPIALPQIAQCLSSIDRILVHSQADIERLRGFGVDSNVELFPHGYPEPGPFDLAASRQSLQLPPGIPIIGSYGFFLPHKGINKLIHALARLKGADIQAKLLLVNARHPNTVSERCIAACRDLVAELDIADDVVFETRFLPPQESLRLLTACDVIVFPYESTGKSSSAAVRLGLASRRPVMCSPLTIFSDVAGVVHFLQGARPDDIYEDLRAFLSDREGRERLAARQAQWVEEHSWRRVAQLLQEKVQQPAPGQVPSERNSWVCQYVSDLLADYQAAERHARNTENDARAQIAAAEDDARARIAAVEDEVRAAEQECQRWESSAETTARQLQEIYKSSSWRITGPLRGATVVSRTLSRALAARLASARRLAPRRASATSAPGKETPQVVQAATVNLSPREQAIYLDLQRATQRN